MVLKFSLNISINPQIYGGVPVITGTRFTVVQFLAEVRECGSVEQVVEEFDLGDFVCLNDI